MTFSQKINRIFALALLISIGITFVCYRYMDNALTKQARQEAASRLENLVESQIVALTSEVLNNRFYGISIRAQSLIEENRSYNLQISIADEKGNRIYESQGYQPAVAKSRPIGRDPTKSGPLIYQREIVLGENPIGRVTFLMMAQDTDGQVMRDSLLATIFVLFVALAGLFLAIRYLLRRSILDPVDKLTVAIDYASNFLRGDSNDLLLPKAIKSVEFQKFTNYLFGVAVKLKRETSMREEVIRQSERESAIARMSQVIAHDLRGPLASFERLINAPCSDQVDHLRSQARSSLHRIQTLVEAFKNSEVEAIVTRTWQRLS